MANPQNNKNMDPHIAAKSPCWMKSSGKTPFIHKRHFLLLEVLIAFVIIAICMLPLISPHTFILKEQNKFIEQVELDHLVNLIYADIVERLYRNEITWSSVTGGVDFDIDEAMWERIRFFKKLPYKGIYRFNEVIHKPADESPRKLYLFNLEIVLAPQRTAPGASEAPGMLRYRYDVFMIRDLSQTAPPSGGTDETGNQDQQKPVDDGGSP